MNDSEKEEALALLRQVGCTSGEIERFCQLRRDYVEKQQRMQRDQRRPAFVHWLLRILQEGFPLPAQEGYSETAQHTSSVWYWPGY